MTVKTRKSVNEVVLYKCDECEQRSPSYLIAVSGAYEAKGCPEP